MHTVVGEPQAVSERGSVILAETRRLWEGGHTLIPLGFAQFGFIASSLVIVAAGAVLTSGSSSIMDSHVPMPYVLAAFAMLVSCTWAVSRYARGFATKEQMDEAERRIKDDFRRELRETAARLEKKIREDR